MPGRLKRKLLRMEELRLWASSIKASQKARLMLSLLLIELWS